MVKLKCLECNWTGMSEKLRKNKRCPKCKSNKVIISLWEEKNMTEKEEGEKGRGEEIEEEMDEF